jgi:hypothetical protein
VGPSFVAKEVGDQMVKSGVEIDVPSFRVDEKVTIAPADGTVAADYLAV